MIHDDGHDESHDETRFKNETKKRWAQDQMKKWTEVKCTLRQSPFHLETGILGAQSPQS